MQYQNSNQDSVSANQILIVGLGGAGTNIANSVKKSGLKGADTLIINADARALETSSISKKIQLGAKLRRGLACGGDPQLGLRAAQETEDEIRSAVKGKRIVFLCVGLGGGTGSGASPLITRIAREEDAFVVVFATMPFSFEGKRRRDQAETSLNELAAIASALVTFDNGRMAELVSSSQSVHDAFEASNDLISRSITSISRIALYPGIVHIGLDDLVSTLSAKRSRCLFGAGSAKGKTRVEKSLKQALASPLIDKGKLLNTSEKVIVHICGGPSTTMDETQKFMEGVMKNLGADVEIFFGISIDESMGEEFTATIISSLPEERVIIEDESEASENSIEDLAEISDGGSADAGALSGKINALLTSKSGAPEEESVITDEEDELTNEEEPTSDNDDLTELTTEEVESDLDTEITIVDEKVEPVADLEEPEPSTLGEDTTQTETDSTETPEELIAEEPADEVADLETVEAEIAEPEPAEEITTEDFPVGPEAEEPVTSDHSTDPETHEVDSELEEEDSDKESSPIRRRFAHLFAGPGKSADTTEEASSVVTEEPENVDPVEPTELVAEEPKAEKAKPDLKDDLFGDSGQGDFFGEEKPKGRFEGESPNIYDGEDLDVPTFLRSSD